MPIHTMRIVTHDESDSDSRIIIEVNGCELDILAVEDGMVVTLSKGNDVKAELPFDWENLDKEPDPFIGL
jgi:hypothetical protein